MYFHQQLGNFNFFMVKSMKSNLKKLHVYMRISFQFRHDFCIVNQLCLE